jgi:hypothetical protein
MLKFTASDIEKGKQCYNCSNTLNCLTHCQVYYTHTFFTWNIETGHWNCLDYGKLTHLSSTNAAATAANSSGSKMYKKTSSNPDKQTMMAKLTKLTQSLYGAATNDDAHYLGHLRILDSCNEKTKDKLIDLDNMIEFYRKGEGDNSSSSDISSNEEEEEEDEDDDSGAESANESSDDD